MMLMMNTAGLYLTRLVAWFPSTPGRQALRVIRVRILQTYQTVTPVTLMCQGKIKARLLQTCLSEYCCKQLRDWLVVVIWRMSKTHAHASRM